MVLPADPSAATLEVLSTVHDSMARSNDLVGRIQAILRGESRTDGKGIFALFRETCERLNTQTRLLNTLVESQLVLDERLKAIVTVMEESDEPTNASDGGDTHVAERLGDGREDALDGA